MFKSENALLSRDDLFYIRRMQWNDVYIIRDERTYRLDDDEWRKFIRHIENVVNGDEKADEGFLRPFLMAIQVHQNKGRRGMKWSIPDFILNHDLYSIMAERAYDIDYADIARIIEEHKGPEVYLR